MTDVHMENAAMLWWSNLHPSGREAVAKLVGWRTRKGSLNPTGRRIVKTRWASLSPAAQKLLIRHFTQVHSRLKATFAA